MTKDAEAKFGEKVAYRRAKPKPLQSRLICYSTLVQPADLYMVSKLARQHSFVSSFLPLGWFNPAWHVGPKSSMYQAHLQSPADAGRTLAAGKPPQKIASTARQLLMNQPAATIAGLQMCIFVSYTNKGSLPIAITIAPSTFVEDAV